MAAFIRRAGRKVRIDDIRMPVDGQDLVLRRQTPKSRTFGRMSQAVFESLDGRGQFWQHRHLFKKTPTPKTV
jgi:hypothetical protein